MTWHVSKALVVSQMLFILMLLPLIVDDGMAMYILKLEYPWYPLLLIVMAGSVRVKVERCFPGEVGL